MIQKIRKLPDWIKIILVLGMVALMFVGVSFHASYIERRYGVMHCGQVQTKTPDGDVAYEKQCWRSKD